MKPTTHTSAVTLLPGRVDSVLLSKFLLEGEPVIVVKLVGVGNTAPYDFRGKGTRSFMFRFDSRLDGHTLRVPLHLWQEAQGRLAHELMDQRHLTHSMIVLVEMPSAPAAVPPLPPPAADEQRGATDTSTSTRNVVGPGSVEPTVAPASGNAQGLDEARPVHEASSSPEPLPLHEGRPLHEALFTLVESPKRIKALAALLGVTEPILRRAITTADSHIELAASGWLRRKSAPPAATVTTTLNTTPATNSALTTATT